MHSLLLLRVFRVSGRPPDRRQRESYGRKATYIIVVHVLAACVFDVLRVCVCACVCVCLCVCVCVHVYVFVVGGTERKGFVTEEGCAGK